MNLSYGLSERKVFLYVMDIIKMLNISSETFLEYSKDPIELFNMVKSDVEKYVGEIYDVRIYKVFLDPKEIDGVIEYTVSSSIGVVSVKIIYSNKPVKTLIKYYRFERGNSRS